MAGLGFKDFQVGEVLTSADVDGYLMQQTVMRFADAGARGSALGTATGTGIPLAEGMVTYLDDSDVVQVYSGAAWTSVGVVQKVEVDVHTSSQSTTATSFQDVTNFNIAYTPLRSGSTLLFVLTVQQSQNSPGEHGQFEIYDATNAASIGIVQVGRPNGQGDFVAVLSTTSAATNTTARTYQVRFKSSNAANTVTICPSSRPSALSIVEYAA